MVKKTIAPYFAEKSIRLGELEPRHIQQFYSEQLKRVKANTVIHYHANIHSALKYAMKIDLIDVNVAGKVDRPKPDYISSTFSVLLEKKGLKRIRFHDLRHSCASLLLANGVPMKQIQEWLGHSDFNTTANIYAHLDYSSKVTSAQAMEKGLPLPAGFNTNGWNGVVSI